MKLVSWNVAGLRACYKKGFADFFKEVAADIFCIQESKVIFDEIPFFCDAYYLYLNPAEKKGYSGTIIYSKREPISVKYGMGIEIHDHEGRIITLEFEQFYVVNVYVPNVKRDLSRLEYRMKWEKDFLSYLKSLEENKPIIICGDFNVAHQEIDIKNAKQNVGNAGFTFEEREQFTNLLAHGFVDTYRYFHMNETDIYTWWSYMKGVRDRNIGWRIDYFLVSEILLGKIVNTSVYSSVLGSDHCPIGIEIEEY